MKHYNPTITEDAARIFNTKGSETLSPNVKDEIQPVVLIQRKCNIVGANTLTNGTSATLLTTPSDKDFYITTIQMSIIKDATSTSTISNINAVIDGVTRSLLRIVGITLTAQQDSCSLSLPIPLKVDRATSIVVTASTNVANISVSGIVIGYTVETTNRV